jgi:hypothetical protein
VAGEAAFAFGFCFLLGLFEESGFLRLGYGKLQKAKRKKKKYSPTDRNNPTDGKVFYPLGCFYLLETIFEGKIFGRILLHLVSSISK